MRLPSGDLETLQRHRVLQLRERMAASRWKDERLVFPNQSGGVMRHNQRRREFKRHLREADLSPFRMHDCRHTAITLQLQAGIPVPTVSQIAGHKNPVEALRRYSHVLQDHQQAAARIMDQMDF